MFFFFFFWPQEKGKEGAIAKRTLHPHVSVYKLSAAKYLLFYMGVLSLIIFRN